MEFKDINEDSKYIYYVAENESMYNLTDLIRDRLGGMNVRLAEVGKVLQAGFRGVVVCASFLFMPKRETVARCWLGHGTSDKGILKLTPPLSTTGYDWYFVSGMKDSWLYNKHGHQLHAPTDREIKTGLLRSDKVLKGEYNKQTILKELGLTNERPIVVFMPTFNSESFEMYSGRFIKELADKYTLVISMHDRDFRANSREMKNVHFFKGSGIDPMKLLAIADYYIGDGSSMDYEMLFFRKPMVMVRPAKPINIDVCYEYDIRNTCVYYEIDQDIKWALEESAKPKYIDLKSDLIEKAFYFNDGHAVDRTCGAVQEFVGRIKWWESLS